VTLRSPFTTITTEGSLLSVDLLARLARQPTTVSGTSADDYHLPPGRRVRDAINRSWTELQGAWSAYAAELERLPGGERATTITRERWLLPLFAELGFGRLQRTSALNVNGRDYPISHLWGAVPIHLLGADVELDRRTRGVAGAASAAPFSMVQELLNRSEAHLWAVLSNGRRLRLLRDNTSLTRAAYVEFDLEAMFSGQVFTDFAVLWMACHESRFEADQPAHCWLERWIEEARQQGVRALDRLRNGFERAITALGGGFLAHPANAALRDRLRQGELAAEDYHRQVLRLVYRLVFLLVAEDRDLFHPPDTSDEARRRYARYYSLGRIRDHARRHRGGRHADLFASLRPVFEALGGDGIPAIGVPALGSFLWSPSACPDLDTAALSNSDILDAIRHLAYTEHDRTLQRVDFANLGAEELGSVYESLLELHPRLELDAARFELVSVAGSERKSTGSYYTPTALISALLDQALDPLLDEADAAPDPAAAILAIKVLDPACGSGHFLTAAARRLATRLAAAQTGELNPTPESTRHALRQVVGRCIYGIDLNPMAIELAKVNLWLDAVEPGLPLRFLDHHLVCGNGLVGATPRLIAEGIPDQAFKPIEGDDKPTAAARKKTNAAERRQRNQGLLALGDSALAAADQLAKAVQVLDTEDDSTPDALRAKQQHWEEIYSSPEARLAKLVADTWCAAFFAPKTPVHPAITAQTLRAVSADRTANPDAIRLVVQLSERYRFLHPHLAFPDVFVAEPDAESGWRGGFDVVLGNPPWDKVEFHEKEFFASRRPEIAEAAGARRKRLIAELEHGDETERALWEEYRDALERSEAAAHFLRDSGHYPLSGLGRLNTYAVFAEAMRALVAPTGRVGVIVPTGIATDDTTKAFFQAVSSGELVSLYDFENRRGLFPAVDSRQKFCLLTLSGRERPVAEAELAFFCHGVADLEDPERLFSLSPEEIALLNPNTRTCPVFRCRRDAELTLGIYRRVPVLLREGRPEVNPWEITFRQGLFNMTSDSSLFRTRDELEAEGYELRGNVFEKGAEQYLPLYEAKMVSFYDHRAADVVLSPTAAARQRQPRYLTAEEHRDPTRPAYPLSWVNHAEVDTRLEDWPHSWLLGFCRVTSSTNERSFIPAVIPRCAVGNSLPLMLSSSTPREVALLGASLASLALDFVARQKVGGINLSFFLVEQFPVLPPATYDQRAPWDQDRTIADWLMPRILELTYTAWDLAGFACDLGYDGPPFRFDGERRAELRAEIDACFFHLYGIDREDTEYILGSFPIVARHDEAAFGEARTKRLVLERYDAMTKATATKEPYEVPLDPPPADPRAAHPPRGDERSGQ
jgi:hypothetical protein